MFSNCKKGKRQHWIVEWASYIYDIYFLTEGWAVLWLIQHLFNDWSQEDKLKILRRETPAVQHPVSSYN